MVELKEEAIKKSKDVRKNNSYEFTNYRMKRDVFKSKKLSNLS